MITLSDFGAEDLAYLAVPVTPPTLGIVLVPTPTASMPSPRPRPIVSPGLGYLALAVDIYNGRQTTDPGDLSNLIANLNAASVMKTIDSGVRFFHESPKFRVDHVVIMGWGTGATYAFQSDRENKMIDGRDYVLRPHHHARALDRQILRAPLCAVYADKDPSCDSRGRAQFPAAHEGRGQRLRSLVHRRRDRLVKIPKARPTVRLRTRKPGKSRRPFIIPHCRTTGQAEGRFDHRQGQGQNRKHL